MVKKEGFEDLYESAVETHKQNVGDRKEVFEKPVYYDGRQYSVKLPAKLFQFIDFKKGDKLIFEVTKTDSKQPVVTIKYARENAKVQD